MAIPTVVQELILEAWDKVLPRLLKDPDELAARLARRRLGVLARPWRPFCLAVRAADTRINPYWFVITPEHALRLDDPRHPYEYLEHDVTLTSERLRMLAKPYRIMPPGEPAFELCRKLGRDYRTFAAAMKRGVFHVNPKKGLRGRRGHPVPVLYLDRWLDPTSLHNLEFPNPLWGTHPDCGPLWKRIPEGIEQTVRRVPTYRKDRDGRTFVGWQWLCPACQHRSRLIYRPLPPPMLTLDEDLPAAVRRRIADCDPREPGLQCFACEHCHAIRKPPRDHSSLWNVLVTLFTAGLLSGREVDTPPSFDKRAHTPRKNTFAPRRKHPPRTPTRAEVLRLLLETDWGQRRIARALGLSHTAARPHIRRIFRDHNVSTRAELRKAHARQRAAAAPAIPNVA